MNGMVQKKADLNHAGYVTSDDISDPFLYTWTKQ